MKKPKTKVVTKKVLSLAEGDATDALRRVIICRDSSPESPREWDNVCTIFSDCRYLSSDDNAMNPVVDYGNSPDEAKFYNGVYALPIYAYVHSGMSLSLSPFNDRWDSGCAGWIYVNKEAFCKEYGLKRFSPRRFRKIAEGEIATLNDYVQGNVYGYKVETRETPTAEWKEEDSCWGYYSDDYVNEMVAEAGGADVGTIICEGAEAYWCMDNVTMKVAVKTEQTEKRKVA